MGFWKTLMSFVTEDYTKTSESRNEKSSLIIDITPSQKKSANEGRHFNEIIQDANTGKDLKPGEASRIIRLMMPENPIDQLFEKVIQKKGDPFLPEMDSSLLDLEVYVVDFEQNNQPKKWEGEVELYTSQNRLDQGLNIRSNVSLMIPATKTLFKDFIRNLAENARVTVNPRTPAVGCFEWRGGKFSYRGLPKK